MGCGWKIRFSQLLNVPSAQSTKPAHPLPASDIYYLFADRFLEPVSGDDAARQAESLIVDRAPVHKESLVLGLCRVAFIWLAVSGHVELQLGSRHLAFSRSRGVIVLPKGIFEVPTGSLEARILDNVYDRRQGIPVDEIFAKIMGFWYQDDPCNWILQLVKQHLLSSPYSMDGKRIGAQQLKELESQAEQVRTVLNDFAFAQPDLVAALWDSVRRGLNAKRG